jgi:outer membrane protein OmpA-like peptidoglycan-associated protein
VGQAILIPENYTLLSKVQQTIQVFGQPKVTIEGHTDSTGSDSYNQMLSQQRAQAVSSVLIRDGVEAVRIDTVGYGESRPVASNATPSGRQLNRRVELTLLPYVE